MKAHGITIQSVMKVLQLRFILFFSPGFARSPARPIFLAGRRGNHDWSWPFGYEMSPLYHLIPSDVRVKFFFLQTTKKKILGGGHVRQGHGNISAEFEALVISESLSHTEKRKDQAFHLPQTSHNQYFFPLQGPMLQRGSIFHPRLQRCGLPEFINEELWTPNQSFKNTLFWFILMPRLEKHK